MIKGKHYRKYCNYYCPIIRTCRKARHTIEGHEEFSNSPKIPVNGQLWLISKATRFLGKCHRNNITDEMTIKTIE